MTLTLRPYQQLAITLARNSIHEGNKRIVIALATGGGKSAICEAMITGATSKGKRVMFLVNRVQLADQMSAHLSKSRIQHGVIQGANTRATYHDVIIASIDSIHKRGYPECDLILADECFSGETLISTPMGLKRIDSMRCGNTVYNQNGIGIVEGVSAKPVCETYRLEFDDGTSTECTGDHPYFTSGGWKPAKEMAVGSYFFSIEGMRVLWKNVQALDQVGAGWEKDFWSFGGGLEQAIMLLRVLCEEIKKPNEQSSIKNENACASSGDTSHAYSAWRQRAITAFASACDIARAGRGVGIGSCSADEDSERKWLSYVLQSGCGESKIDDSHRNGRWVTHDNREEISGSKKNRSSYFPRLVRISRIEREGATSVFNLRVSGHPSYFADGKLVHNCHAAAGSMKYHKLFEHYKDTATIIGVTATPMAKGLGKHHKWGVLFQDIVCPITIPELIEQGYLVDVDIYAPSAPDLSKVKIVAGDYHEGQLGEAVDKPTLIGDIVDQWHKYANGKQTIAFAVNIPHSQHITERFIAAGVSAVHIDYSMEYEEKRDIINRFKAGEFTVLSNCALLSEGFDAPATECMILARPTKSLARYIQMAGRILRPAPGKTRAVLLDHSGTALQLGFPTDAIDYTLDDGNNKKSGSASKEEKEPAKPIKCPSCNYVKKNGGKCPVCGFMPAKPNTTEHAPGELVKMTKKEQAKSAKLAGLDKQAVYSELFQMRSEHGYKEKWVDAQYKSIFGVWPRGLKDVPKEPTQQVSNMVTANRIRYAKGKANVAR